MEEMKMFFLLIYWVWCFSHENISYLFFFILSSTLLQFIAG
uniref:Uncharacterized protein n=1 Tax=Heterorhabditis bacteriophora TaxID=37862 RepID=A0A1I7XCB2_HETBA